MAETETPTDDPTASSPDDVESEEDYSEHHDPLLECLMVAGKLYGKALSRDSLTMGLPLVDNRL
ncbi:MAG: hypothetical protein GXP30_11260, partial [Verrucomicrobia bacterium]|nr:hypothetical protein [Verrucomicrobiota bacterium]